MRFLLRLVVVGALALCLIARMQSTNAAAAASVGLQIIVVNSLPEAQSIAKRLETGEDFAGVAREKSIDPSANQGGDLGQMDTSSLRAELRDALANVAPGKLTKIVKISSGFAILKVVNRTNATPAPVDPTRLLPLAGAGSVRLSPDIGGFTQANVAMRVSMPQDPAFGQDLREVCEVRRRSVSSVLEKINALFLAGNIEPDKLIYAHFTAGQLLAYEGNIEKAIAEWEAAYKLSGESGKMSPQLEEALGLAYFYHASPDESAAQATDISHLFPMHPGALHPNNAELDKASAFLLKCLRRESSNLELEWLLNLCAMTTGTYPAGVPKAYLIPPDRFKSKADAPHFVDVAPAAGLNIRTTAGGAIVDDFDNDGLLDVITSQQDDCAPLHFFHNDGKGAFSDRSAQAGLADQLGGLNVMQADYNNDGFVDVLVLRGGWEFPRRVSLLRNNGDGTFVDVTKESGLAEPARSTQSAVWADIDNDGKLDLFFANENAPGELLLNKGDGTFVDISKSAGVDRVGFSKAVVSADYDDDGFPDFYVSNLNGENFLYHNNGNKTFTDVAATAGVQGPWASFAAWFFDYDNDGRQDLFVTSYYMSTEETARNYKGLTPNAETLKLYKNTGSGHFSDVTADTALNRVFMPMGSNFGDIDNDGFPDIYLGNGNPSFASLVPNVMLRNQGGKSFIDVTAASQTGAMAKGHAIAFADIDNDGDEDIFAVVGGAVPGDRHRARLFENPGNENDWVTLKLTGVRSNTSAIGARIKLTVDDGEGVRRTICRTVGSGGSFGASPFQQHIGLGRGAHIQSLEIWWPASNTRQHFSNVASNQFLQIKEFDANYTKVNRISFQLGGAKRMTGRNRGS